MKVIKTGCFLILSLMANKINAGCNEPGCGTSNGIKFYGISHGSASVRQNEKDSFDVFTISSTCTMYNATGVRVYYNNILVDSFKKRFTLLQKPGHYKVTAKFNFSTIPCLWEFDILPKPTEIINIATGIKLSTITEINNETIDPEILLFPNPATNNITVLNEYEEIKKVLIYNLSGELINSLQLNETKINIPLENFPSGIYFMHVATLSEKIIVKRFVVL
ncbi:MAG: T9SS type A sorting domain-containing protein [Bacteroidetes bacterium]|nr:T9SS type A sorting domain-containing protein [Bacteroidota bacterium]